LFATLDQNGDGQISADERSTGVDRLTVRDLDDDETLSLQELATQPYPTLNYGNSYVTGGSGEATGSNNRTAKFVTLRTPLDRKECAERWIHDYGKGQQLRVAMTSPLANAARHAKPDAVQHESSPLGIAFLDAAALAEALERPPADMELLIRLGKKAEKELPRVAFITPDGATLPADAGGIKFSSTNGSRVFETATERVELVAASDNDSERQKRQFQQYFKQADRDNNKYLDKQEAQQYANFGASFAVLDANGDEKIFAEEFDPWLDRQLASAACRAVLSANDAGHPFFPSFDTNGDGRLGLRELRVGLAGLLSRDANGDGSLSEKELVHLYRLSVAQGQTNIGSVFGVTFAYSVASDGRIKPTKGPEWFRNMDRNQDGDVSPREFLGTAENFKALDSDGDGLLDGKEAATKKK
jgi:Ca2+-binding EF-hand superfamily protein